MRDYEVFYERVGGAVELVGARLGYRQEHIDRVEGSVTLRRRVLGLLPVILRVHVKAFPGGARVWLEGPRLAARQFLQSLDAELRGDLARGSSLPTA